jgi:YegS/Rv2252/BmrU family lipid kinase
VPRRILVIVNPAAGRPKRSARRLGRVVAELERRGCTVVVRRTRGPAEAERLARAAEPAFDLIVAAGGDGTVNEVVNGLAGSSLPMAVLPLGIGNVLAHEIGLPRQPAELARVIADGPPLPVWPGRVGDRLFVAMTGVGFDAEVVGALDQRLKRRVGKLAFVWAIVLCLHRYRPHELIVEADDNIHRAASVIIATGRLYAGRFVIAPDARLGDPRLHVVLFRNAGRVAALRFLGAMMLGVLHRRSDVLIVTARRVSVAASGAASDRARVEIDGEIGAGLPIAVEIAPTPLLLVHPAMPPTAPGTGPERSLLDHSQRPAGQLQFTSRMGWRRRRECSTGRWFF